MQSKSTSLKQRATQALQSGRFGEARQYAADACKADRRDVEAWTLAAAASANLGDMEGVAEACRSIIALQPQNPMGHYNLGVAYQTMGRHDKAEAAYRKSLALQPANPPAAANLGHVLLAQGRPQEAIEAFERALAAEPALVAAHDGIGLALKKLGEFAKAIERFQQTLQRAPQSAETHLNLGSTYLASGEPALAKECFERAIAARPDFAEAHYELGMLLIQDKQYPEAEAHFARALNLRPQYNAALFQLAHTHYLQEQFPQAVIHYREFLTREPGQVAALNNLGRIYERTGQYEEAIRQYRAALKQKGDECTIYCNIGRTCMAQRDWDAAAKHYRKAIAANPQAYDGHLGLGQAYCEMGALESAKACFEKTVELRPDLPIARYLLANVDSGGASGAAISDYVAGLFDDYADKFDKDLVEKLKYRTPDLINDMVRKHLADNAARIDIMDLGCGTGLCGPLLKDIAARLDGVDLSARMIDKARERGVYDELHVGDITTVMNTCGRQYDLVISADVFVYIGDLTPVFDAVLRILRPGGLFAFSVELHEGDGYRLLSSGRQAHSVPYIDGLFAKHGLIPLSREQCDLRLERGVPVKGMVYIARRG